MNLDSAVIYNFTHINETALARLLKASTGIRPFGSSGTLFKIGERASNLKRLISCKLGAGEKIITYQRLYQQLLKLGIPLESLSILKKS